MTRSRIGSLCTGYGGLDHAVIEVLGGELAWVADNDPGAAAILAHHHPDVPNLGDITAVDWAQVEPVDIVTAGFPCQDVSLAGRGAGLAEGTRTGVWTYVAAAIRAFRPGLVLLENVEGLLSARADSAMEPCPWCVGDDGGQPALRALGAVLGDLAEAGFDAEWHSVTASDVGSAHRRLRVFVLAWPAADSADNGFQRGGSHGMGGPDLRTAVAAIADADSECSDQRRDAASRQAESRRPLADDRGRDRAPVELLPTPAARDGKGRDLPSRSGGASLPSALLPTPRATDGTKGGPNQRGSSGDLMLPSAVQRLLPTPRATRGGSATETVTLLPTPTATPYGNNQSSSPGAAVRPSLNSVPEIDWGKYGLAIRRWEQATRRAAPSPTEPGREGKPRLSPRFVEWLMGLPEGHVTGVPVLSRNAQLKALGNGVVPQQAAYALRLLLDRMEAAA